MKIITTAISIACLIFLTGCEALKYKKVSAKEFPPDPDERVKKNMEEGRKNKKWTRIFQKLEHTMQLLG